MTGRLESKVAIITGAAMGLGAADATLFAKKVQKLYLPMLLLIKVKN